MTLCDILNTAQYFQKFEVYVTNAYDQNVLIGNGERQEMLDNWEEVFDHLMDTVEYFSTEKFSDNGAIVIMLRDKHYEERLETQFSDKDYTSKWSPSDPKSRPFKYAVEIFNKHREGGEKDEEKRY